MRYIVALHSLSEMDLGPDDDGTESPSGVYESDVDKLIPCLDKDQVGKAILDRGPSDWAVFEFTGGKMLRRAVTFAKDGASVVEIS